jgi:hypothetical protein
MANKNTHIGTIVGCDARTKEGTKYLVNLRETKNFWVANTVKYRKTTGYPVGTDWPMYQLVLDSIKAIENGK